MLGVEVHSTCNGGMVLKGVVANILNSLLECSDVQMTKDSFLSLKSVQISVR